MPSHVPQRVGRRADLLSLQKHGRMAEGCASAVASCQQAPIAVRPRVSVQLAEGNPQGAEFSDHVCSGWCLLSPTCRNSAGGVALSSCGISGGSLVANSQFNMNAIESWETEGGALVYHTPAGSSTSSIALPAEQEGSYQIAKESLATSGADSSNNSRTSTMASRYPKFQNDRAVSEIRIGTREFKCIGVSPPHDHPHVYIDMGDDDTISCPYCATRYRFDPQLALFESETGDSIFVDPEEV